MTVSPLRVCIIGNSHVGALKEAWDEIGADHTSVEMTFFAARGRRLKDLVVDGNALRAGGPDAAGLSQFLSFTSGGLEQIQGDAYDLFLVYGWGQRFVNLSVVYSLAVLRACVFQRGLTSLQYDITEKVRAITNRPIFVAVSPLLSVWPEEGPTHSYKTVLDIFRDVYAPLDVHFVTQPEETRDTQNRTLSEFLIGSRKLDVGGGAQPHGAKDELHMNAAYGRIWLDHFLASLPVYPKAASVEKSGSS